MPGLACTGERQSAVPSDEGTLRARPVLLSLSHLAYSACQVNVSGSGTGSGSGSVSVSGSIGITVSVTVGIATNI